MFLTSFFICEKPVEKYLFVRLILLVFVVVITFHPLLTHVNSFRMHGESIANLEVRGSGAQPLGVKNSFKTTNE